MFPANTISPRIKESLPSIIVMMKFIFSLLTILLFSASWSIHASHDFPIAKPNCVDVCGEVSIPYPIGTTPECYHDPVFWVTCNHSFNPPKLFWQDSDLEIMDISLDGQVRIMNFVGRDCYAANGTRVESLVPEIELASYITFNITANKFTMVGCDGEAAAQRWEIHDRLQCRV